MIKYGDGQRVSFKPMPPFEDLKNFEGGFRSVYFKNMTIADVFKKAEKEVQQVTDAQIAKLDEILSHKEKEVMEV